MYGRLLLVGCLLLAACQGPTLRAPRVASSEVAEESERQKETALREYQRRQARIDAVAVRLRVDNVGLCGEDAYEIIGVQMAGRRSFDSAYAAAAARLWRLDDGGVRVLSVAPASPGESAGLEPGDRIRAVEGIAVESPEDVLDWVTNRGGRPAALEVERKRARRPLSIQPVMACGYPVVLVTHDSVNAFADGRIVGLTTGMLRFAESDDELAIVIGHELAHNVLDHCEKARSNAAGGMVLGGGDDGFLSTHPSPAERAIVLEAIVAEIRAKREAGRALEPERR